MIVSHFINNVGLHVIVVKQTKVVVKEQFVQVVSGRSSACLRMIQDVLIVGKSALVIGMVVVNLISV